MSDRDRLDTPFEQFSVRYYNTGGTKVEWTLHRQFTDPEPHAFQLQGATGPVATADWRDVGLPASNVFFLVDDEQRLYGASDDWYYRIKLTTPLRDYYSKVLSNRESLCFRDWRLASDMIRKEKLRLENYTGTDMVLLKRKRAGTRCTACTDPLTNEVNNSNCETCEGTGFVDGYFAGVPAFVETPPARADEQVDNVQAAGHVHNTVVPDCRVMGEPAPNVYDVFVDENAGVRYVVRRVQDVAVHRGYPIATTVTLNRLPFGDRAYRVPLEGA